MTANGSATRRFANSARKPGWTPPAGALTRLGIYDHPDRDPRGRVISVAYHLALPRRAALQAGDDARDAAWHSLNALHTADLAFDHAHILHDAGLT
ncbi:8-oxo-dGTP diphosphatase [Actinopolyspora xinjiangensis]|uniref:8-oxo-dGTP diphosphatase n=1 Tax=Actinopolyspora xinjiangensis TaxID=405564 RepID=A0A1H0WC30_9ACTN|nr:hypothetical protein [Actinopolyspora xinjiangensis]SDP88005.1 8-oxo-dGTP diphosphatase [Actinopolyspora xinjiangensis]